MSKRVQSNFIKTLHLDSLGKKFRSLPKWTFFKGGDRGNFPKELEVRMVQKSEILWEVNWTRISFVAENVDYN